MKKLKDKRLYPGKRAPPDLLARWDPLLTGVFSVELTGLRECR